MTTLILISLTHSFHPSACLHRIDYLEEASDTIHSNSCLNLPAGHSWFSFVGLLDFLQCCWLLTPLRIFRLYVTYCNSVGNPRLDSTIAPKACPLIHRGASPASDSVDRLSKILE